jgi:hypothetical protein
MQCPPIGRGSQGASSELRHRRRLTVSEDPPGGAHMCQSRRVPSRPRDGTAEIPGRRFCAWRLRYEGRWLVGSCRASPAFERGLVATCRQKVGESPCKRAKRRRIDGYALSVRLAPIADPSLGASSSRKQTSRVSIGAILRRNMRSLRGGGPISGGELASISSAETDKQ